MDEYNREKAIAALILAAGRSSRMQHGQESYHKLLLPLGQGTVLSHVIAATLASQARPIILILGYQNEQIRASLTSYFGEDKFHPYHDIIITENTAYAEGMSTSLHLGIQILIAFPLDPLGSGGYTFPVRRQWESMSLLDPLEGTEIRRETTETSLAPTISSSNIQCDGALVLLGDQPLITPALLNQLIATKYATGKRIIAPFYNGKRGNPVLFDADLFPELLTITGDEGARSIIEKHRTEMAMLDIRASQLWYDVDTWEAYQQVLHTWQEQQE